MIWTDSCHLQSSRRSHWLLNLRLWICFDSSSPSGLQTENTVARFAFRSLLASQSFVFPLLHCFEAKQPDTCGIYHGESWLFVCCTPRRREGDVSGRIWVPVPIKEDPITVYISAPRLQDPQLHTFFFYPSPYSAGEHHAYVKHLLSKAYVR